MSERLYTIEGVRGLMVADSVAAIINHIHTVGLDGLQFTVFSAGPEHGTYAKFDGKYRKISDDYRTIQERIRMQKEWSEKTFGPGRRTKGITEHIRKELMEIEENPNDLVEWIDVVILGLDGAWRTGATPDQILEALIAKQNKNFARVYPYPESEDHPSEHDRTIPE